MFKNERELEIFKIITIEYWVNNKTITQINKENKFNARYWMLLFGISRRKHGQHREWKEWNDLTYKSKHNRMRKIIIKPYKCTICNNEKRLSLTNLNHKYNNNPNEWKWMCYLCHERYDKKYNDKITGGDSHKKNQKIYNCRAYLFINYILLKKSGVEIGKECNCNYSTIYIQLKKFQIKKIKGVNKK